MTTVISDTDILSTFGKIARVDLLQRLFPHVYVAPAVYRELLRYTTQLFSALVRLGVRGTQAVCPIRSTVRQTVVAIPANS